MAWLARSLMMAVALLATTVAPWAQTADRAGAIQADTDQPIEINADSLEVQQDNNLAIFTGNVDAAQGRIRLRADRLTVHYRPGGSAAADVQGTISRIEATGQVFVWSPEETAQGDNGVYDVASKQIVLTGTVVLTRGDNVVRGKRLVMNMQTGRSEMKGGRVQGIFVPPKKQ